MRESVEDVRGLERDSGHARIGGRCILKFKKSEMIYHIRSDICHLRSVGMPPIRESVEDIGYSSSHVESYDISLNI
jgi:hypothetical protein